jgi:hypothetical protein
MLSVNLWQGNPLTLSQEMIIRESATGNFSKRSASNSMCQTAKAVEDTCCRNEASGMITIMTTGAALIWKW